MAVSALKCGLLPLTQTAMRWGKIAYHDFEGVAVELDERKRLVEDLGDCEVMILRNHGLLVGRRRPSARRSTTSIAWSAPARPSFWRWPATARSPCRRSEVIATSNAQLTVHAVAGRQGQEAAARLAGMAGAQAHARPARSVVQDLRPAQKRRFLRHDLDVPVLPGRSFPAPERFLYCPARFAGQRDDDDRHRQAISAARADGLTAIVDYAVASHARAVAVLVLAALLAFLPGFFQIPPIDRDEARFAQATKQMVETGDYVDIRFQDEVRYKKPVGIYWLQAGRGQDRRSARRAERAHDDLALSHSLADRRDRRGAADLLGGARLRLAPRRAAGRPDDGDLDPARRRGAARQDRRHAAADRRRRHGRDGARLSRRAPAGARASPAGRCRRSSGPRSPPASCSRAR